MSKPPAPFYRQVYAIVWEIPRGKVTSYGRIAEMLNNPGAARQVGYAMSALKNRADDPAYQGIPWQRVVNHQGQIVIRGSGEGRLYQAELLREEQVAVSKDLKVDLEKHLWDGLLPHEVQALLKEKGI
jgi:methylated-DNA-protein-cysteine methyltransferase-like protein